MSGMSRFCTCLVNVLRFCHPMKEMARLSRKEQKKVIVLNHLGKLAVVNFLEKKERLREKIGYFSIAKFFMELPLEYSEPPGKFLR